MCVCANVQVQVQVLFVPVQEFFLILECISTGKAGLIFGGKVCTFPLLLVFLRYYGILQYIRGATKVLCKDISN